MKERKFALYISLGIEANNLILSGLASRLGEFGKVLAFVHYDSEILDKLLNDSGIAKINISAINLQQTDRHKLENYFLSSRRAKLRLDGIMPVSWRGDIAKKRSKDKIIGNKPVYNILKKLTCYKNEKHYYNSKMAECIRQNKITDIIIQSYSAADAMSLAITAKKTGCKIWCMNWGWKDFFINEFIPFVPNGFFTWSDTYRKLYLNYNSHLSPDKIYSSGNPGFDQYFNYVPKETKKFYSQKYGFELEKPIILYTMINPDVYKHEDMIITKIVQKLKQEKLDVTILLKPNPMDNDTSRFNKIIEENDHVAILENLWIYDHEYNFNLMTKEAKTEWMDILYYCNMTMNVPSTVTIESLIMKKPVINIGFGGREEDNAKILMFSKMPYYNDLFTRNDVLLSSNPDILVSHVKRVLHSNIVVTEEISDILTVTDHATEDVVQTIVKG